jgi:hypothetical protein
MKCAQCSTALQVVWVVPLILLVVLAWCNRRTTLPLDALILFVVRHTVFRRYNTIYHTTMTDVGGQLPPLHGRSPSAVPPPHHNAGSVAHAGER